MSEDIPEEDMEYLEFKGVFRVPDTILRHELLKAFVESVYPFLPVLDLESFLLPVISNDGVQTVSLLLFHAVMFSATAFVQLKHLHNAGYETRKEAREQFYLRARTLYDFDIEKDRVVLIQALLLMTYWHETPDNPKDSQYWLNVCWSLGASIGLDCDPSTSPMNPQLQKVWKRLWWCLYTRDTLLAQNLRRPLCYGNDKNRLPLISLEEFNIGTLHREAGSPRFQGLSLPRAQYGQVICEMPSILQDLNQLGLVQYLPTSTVALLVPVLARLVLDFKANNGCMGIETFERFYQGMQVLGTLGDIYSFAVTVRRFFEGTLHGGKQGSSYVSMPSAIRNLLTKKEQDAFATSELTGVRGNI
ncbi:fungal specific transcription factor domain-containing protein [Aspergillus fischeri NRRL 181]|uniref:Fungal specific transcription factor, putative n=1 Tax=Neosartorya fischeri (strain ATCC 1020 / DSM 3700 / CBS 544.65 / FGSC A1164 / JCM 1740 / NRRL 181 / WB 181) TaxID=331117 RepID=A1D0T5_NEOFI|nr:fungal specific transcription factor, putative [Aspergillus fischeri NRRL 181]EAW24605.1 fungal specific transcription factor, putative [Aspergillus fischeri NRRL 181]